MWEHRTIRVNIVGDSTEALHAAMHELEVLDWELVSVLVTPNDHYRLFFKRQVLDESEKHDSRK